MSPTMMTDYVVSCIDAASKMLGSDAKVAEHLHMPRQNLSEVRHGRRALTLTQVYRLCALANADGQRLATENALRAERDPATREQMRAVLFPAGARGGAWGITQPCGDGATPSDGGHTERKLSGYTKCSAGDRFLGLAGPTAKSLPHPRTRWTGGRIRPRAFPAWTAAPRRATPHSGRAVPAASPAALWARACA